MEIGERRYGIAQIATSLALPVSAVLYFVLEVYLANVLGASGFGRYSAFTAASGVLVYLVTFGIPGASTKIVAEYQATQVPRLLAEYVWWSMTAGCALAVLLGLPFSTIYSRIASPVDLGATGALAIASSCLGLFLWLWSRHVAIGSGDRWISLVPKEIVFPLLLTATVALLSINSFEGIASAYVIVLLLVELPVCVFLLRKLGPGGGLRLRHPRGAEWCSVALPLGIASMASAGLARWDVLSSSALLPPDDVAAYAAAARVALVGGIVQRTFEVLRARELVALRLSAPARRIKQELKRQAAITGGVALLILGGVFLFAEPILRMFGEFAIKGVFALRILIVAQFVHSATAPYDVYMCVGELQKARAVLLVSASATSLALTALGASLFGIVGCAIGVLLSVSGYRIMEVVITDRSLSRLGSAEGR